MIRPTVVRMMQRILPVFEAAPGHYTVSEVSLIRHVAHVVCNLLPSGVRCIQAALVGDVVAGAAIAMDGDALVSDATGTSGSSSSITTTGSRASEQRGDQ